MTSTVTSLGLEGGGGAGRVLAEIEDPIFNSSSRNTRGVGVVRVVQGHTMLEVKGVGVDKGVGGGGGYEVVRLGIFEW